MKLDKPRDMYRHRESLRGIEMEGGRRKGESDIHNYYYTYMLNSLNSFMMRVLNLHVMKPHEPQLLGSTIMLCSK